MTKRYQRGNQNPYIEEQTKQWPKEKVQKYKQRSTKHTYKTKDRVTRTPLKPGVNFIKMSATCLTPKLVQYFIMSIIIEGIE